LVRSKKADIALLAEAVAARLETAGIANLAEVVTLAAAVARNAGMVDPRITSDVKHVEIGLTDKSDSARWAATWLAARGITGALVLVGGDEFGPIGGIAGSDSFMWWTPSPDRGRFGRGRARRRARRGGAPRRGTNSLLGAARRATHTPSQRSGAADRPRPGGGSSVAKRSHRRAVAESLGALGNGFTGTRGSREEDGANAAPGFS